jgi:hypothetical protein
MKLSELLSRFRTESNDKVQPYFNDDVDVTAWLNDAVQEACLRSRLLHEHSNPDVCRIAVSSGRSQYALHDSLYELTNIYYDPGNGACIRQIELASEEMLTCCYYKDWRTRTGRPDHAIQSDTGLRLVPTPDEDGILILEGYRLPLEDMVDPADAPEINKAHHLHLVQWALHKAFSIPDTEFFDPNRAQIAEMKFTEYFGDRPDADLRRDTREDFEHYTLPPLI